MKIYIIILSIALAVLMVLLFFDNMSCILSDIGIDIKPLPIDFESILNMFKR